MIKNVMDYSGTGGSGSPTLGFRFTFEIGPHARPHLFVGGSEDTFASPDDPVFYLHHAFVDKVFAMWQECHNYKDPNAITAQQFPSDLLATELPDSQGFTTR